MAHPQQLQFIRTVSQHLSADWTGKRILEIGSYDVNGSVRQYFENSSYLGVDLTEGPGVDIVCESSELDQPDGAFDLCISCECFEHNPKWLETFLNMHRMTRKGGSVIFTCATTGRLEHGTRRSFTRSSPGTQDSGWDYYLNLTERNFTRKVDMNQLFASYFFVTNTESRDLYFIGVTRGGEQIFRFDCQSLHKECIEVAEHSRRERIDAQLRYPIVFRLLSRLCDLPVRLAMALPDRYYQNFALSYCRILEKFRESARYSVGKVLGVPRPR